jgi:hypothetical protein
LCADQDGHDSGGKAEHGRLGHPKKPTSGLQVEGRTKERTCPKQQTWPSNTRDLQGRPVAFLAVPAISYPTKQLVGMLFFFLRVKVNFITQ